MILVYTALGSEELEIFSKKAIYKDVANLL